MVAVRPQNGLPNYEQTRDKILQTFEAWSYGLAHLGFRVSALGFRGLGGSRVSGSV